MTPERISGGGSVRSIDAACQAFCLNTRRTVITDESGDEVGADEGNLARELNREFGGGIVIGASLHVGIVARLVGMQLARCGERGRANPGKGLITKREQRCIRVNTGDVDL